MCAWLYYSSRRNAHPERAFSSGGERFPDTEEVTSSNLVTPTINFEVGTCFRPFFLPVEWTEWMPEWMRGGRLPPEGRFPAPEFAFPHTDNVSTSTNAATPRGPSAWRPRARPSREGPHAARSLHGSGSSARCRRPLLPSRRPWRGGWGFPRGSSHPAAGGLLQCGRGAPARTRRPRFPRYRSRAKFENFSRRISGSAANGSHTSFTLG